jgi:hypothetical protein
MDFGGVKFFLEIKLVKTGPNGCQGGGRGDDGSAMSSARPSSRPPPFGRAVFVRDDPPIHIPFALPPMRVSMEANFARTRNHYPEEELS